MNQLRNPGNRRKSHRRKSHRRKSHRRKSHRRKSKSVGSSRKRVRSEYMGFSNSPSDTDGAFGFTDSQLNDLDHAPPHSSAVIDSIEDAIFKSLEDYPQDVYSQSENEKFLKENSKTEESKKEKSKKRKTTDDKMKKEKGKSGYSTSAFEEAIKITERQVPEHLAKLEKTNREHDERMRMINNPNLKQNLQILQRAKDEGIQLQF